MMKRRFYIILVFISILSTVYGQSLSVQSSIDKSEMLTGEQANIILNIQTNDLPHTSYSITEGNDSKRFRILNIYASDTISLDDKLKEFKVHVLITSFDSTLITIPPFVVRSGLDSVLSNSLSLKVIQPKVDISKPDKISPEKGLWSINLNFRDYVYIIFHSWIFYTVIFIILVIIISIYVYRHRSIFNKNVIPQKIEKVLSPIEKAQRDFEILDSKDMPSKGNYKPYYTECFDIIRRYIEEKCGWEVLEMTSEDIIDLFNSDGVAKVLSSDLQSIIKECDFVKFAKFTPSIDNALRFRNDAYYWIEKAENIFSSSENNTLEEKEVKL